MKKKKSIQSIIPAQVEIIYSNNLSSEPMKITSSNDAFKLLQSIYNPKKVDYKEFFYVVLLNNAHFVLGVSNISIGNEKGTVVCIKEIFQLALLSNANKILISHNHPSGNLNPSEADNRITNQIRQACKFFDMELLDHIIFTSKGFYSYADNGD